MNRGAVADILAIGLSCDCGEACENDAGSQMITQEDKIATCPHCYAQWLVDEFFFLMAPKQLEAVADLAQDLLLTMPGGDWNALSKQELVRELRRLHAGIEELFRKAGKV